MDIPLSYALLPRVPEKESPPLTPIPQITHMPREDNVQSLHLLLGKAPPERNEPKLANRARVPEHMGTGDPRTQGRDPGQ